MGKKPPTHRRPPLPHWDKGQGHCRWCGEACEPHRRWHGPCVTAYKIACWPSEARFAAWVKDKGVCQGCALDLAAAAHAEYPHRATVESFRKTLPNWGPKWHCDHIRPLIEGDGTDLSFWAVENLRVLCVPCHKKETKALAGRLAAKRKESVAP